MVEGLTSRLSDMNRDQKLFTAVDTYFRALHGCDTHLLDEVFHPAASLFDVDQGEVRVDPFPAWRQVVAARRSPASVGQQRDEEVMSVVWLSARCATVQVRLRVLNEIVVDHLSFAFDGETFRIVSKTWHLERTLTDLTASAD